MKRLIRIVFVTLILFTLTGCTPPAVPISLASPISGEYPNTYRNEDIFIQFTGLTNALSFEITNETELPIKIVWDNCALTNITGQPSRVMHYGIRYLEKDSSFPPSIIPAGQTLKEAATPVDNVTYMGSYLGWMVFWIVPYDSMRTNAGKTISFLLCYEKAAIQYYETFVLTVFPEYQPSAVLDFIETFDTNVSSIVNEIKIQVPLPSAAGISSVFEPTQP